MGTVSLTVQASPPVPRDQAAAAVKGTTTTITPSYTGGGGCTGVSIKKVSGPTGGTLTINGMTFAYTPNSSNLGWDNFTWLMSYNDGTGVKTTAVATCTVFINENVNDWPTFRANSMRTAVTAMELPETLRLQWRRDFRPRITLGSSGLYTSYALSTGIEPIAADGKVFIGSDIDGSLRTYDAATGAELWSACTDGAIRTAPLYYQGKIYAGSDDGFIYCWNADTGALVWKVQAVSGGGGSKLAKKKVFAYDRLTSAWAVTGGLMLENGVLYFASGTWAMEGVFVGGLNPSTGRIVWMNEDYCAREGLAEVLSPKGYLVKSSMTPGGFYVPCPHAKPQWFQFYTGPMDGLTSGGTKADDFARGLAMLHGSSARDPGIVPLGAGSYGFDWIVSHDQIQYVSTQPGWVNTGSDWPVGASVGGNGYDPAILGSVAGTIKRIIAANGRLLVASYSSGGQSLYCFSGDAQASPKSYPVVTTPLSSANDVWKTRATRILSGSAVNDKGVAFVPGIGSGRLAEELILQSSLYVVAVDSDPVKANALRNKLTAAGVYGVRGEVLVESNPADCGLPPYMGRLIVSEDVVAAGFSGGVNFAKGLFRSVRPYGGKAWLFTTSVQHTTFAGWADSAGLVNATVTRDSADEFTVLTRVGALPDAADWIVPAGGGSVGSADQATRGNLGILWWNDRYGYADADLVQGINVKQGGQSRDAYSGVVLNSISSFSGAKKPAANLSVIDQTPGLPRRNPLSGLREPGGNSYPYTTGSGSCSSPNFSPYGRITVGDTTKNSSLYSHDIGLITIPFKDGCPAEDSYAGCGLVGFIGKTGCSCGFTPSIDVMLAHDPDPKYWNENFSQYAFRRLALPVEDDPTLRMGVNFGAPKEHMDTNGILWVSDDGFVAKIDQNVTYGLGENAVEYEPKTAQRFYHHSTRMVGSEGPGWVAASVIRGATKIRVPVAKALVAKWDTAAPVLDGALSDACWNGDAGVLMAGRLRYDGGALHAGDVYLRYDAANLYVGAALHSHGASVAGGWSVYLSDRSKLVAPSRGTTKLLGFRID
ncbi:MAG: PQQ-binding-like beta-propeller repeat protein, partial [Kiritimatiellae bacterium]|nr:PQQ-binding-like beta-propeller repeat protein [Kiritimatiellia bacterium]